VKIAMSQIKVFACLVTANPKKIGVACLKISIGFKKMQLLLKQVPLLFNCQKNI